MATGIERDMSKEIKKAGGGNSNNNIYPKDEIIKTYKQSCPLNNLRVKHTMDQLSELGENKKYTSDDIKEATDNLLNQCIGNQLSSDPSITKIRSVCHGQVSKYGGQTLPWCAWNIDASTGILNGRALMFNRSADNPHYLVSQPYAGRLLSS